MGMGVPQKREREIACAATREEAVGVGEPAVGWAGQQAARQSVARHRSNDRSDSTAAAAAAAAAAALAGQRWPARAQPRAFSSQLWNPAPSLSQDAQPQPRQSSRAHPVARVLQPVVEPGTQPQPRCNRSQGKAHALTQSRAFSSQLWNRFSLT